jgi:hypothetical protein
MAEQYGNEGDFSQPEMVQPGEMPLAFRMMENLPGIGASMGFGISRGSQTIMRGGGYMDNIGKGVLGRSNVTRRFSRAERVANKHRVISNGALTEKRAGQFLGGGRRSGYLAARAERLAAGGKSAGFLRSARLNNVTMRPRAIGRYHSLSVLGEGSYTPFGGAGMIGKHIPGMRKALEAQGIVAGEGEKLFGPGAMSFLTAGVKVDKIEKRLAKKVAKGNPFTGGLEKKLGKVDKSIFSLAKMNNRALTQEFLIDNGIKLGGVGVRGDLLASTVGGRGSQFMGGYVRGALGHGGSVVGEAANKGVGLVRKHMADALGEGIVGRGGVTFAGEAGAKAVLEKGAFKTLGKEGVMKALGSKAGLKALGTRAAMLAIPGLNVLATASLIYDLGKMGGEVIKSGINLAKDSVKSLRGDINKPLFGMGYKDTEAAATSRSRGVMAIQNSQLNARSVLGNEGALMAAHFG